MTDTRIVKRIGTPKTYSNLEIYFVRVAIRRGMALSPSGIEIANRYQLWGEQLAGVA